VALYIYIKSLKNNNNNNFFLKKKKKKEKEPATPLAGLGWLNHPMG
jgi:hypothetical protein